MTLFIKQRLSQIAMLGLLLAVPAFASNGNAPNMDPSPAIAKEKVIGVVQDNHVITNNYVTLASVPMDTSQAMFAVIVNKSSTDPADNAKVEQQCPSIGANTENTALATALPADNKKEAAKQSVPNAATTDAPDNAALLANSGEPNAPNLAAA